MTGRVAIESIAKTLAALQRFFFDRLPKVAQPVGDKPCLSENWFVEDARSLAPNWLSDDDLRRIWRVARLQRLGLHPGAGSPWLLLHQVTELLEAMLRQASRIFDEQRQAT